MNLAEVEIGKSARITQVTGTPLLEQRMFEMGLLPGVEVEVVRQAPLGDPIEIRLLGYCLSLRRREAAGIEVEPLP